MDRNFEHTNIQFNSAIWLDKTSIQKFFFKKSGFSYSDSYEWMEQNRFISLAYHTGRLQVDYRQERRNTVHSSMLYIISEASSETRRTCSRTNGVSLQLSRWYLHSPRRDKWLDRSQMWINPSLSCYSMWNISSFISHGIAAQGGYALLGSASQDSIRRLIIRSPASLL